VRCGAPGNLMWEGNGPNIAMAEHVTAWPSGADLGCPHPAEHLSYRRTLGALLPDGAWAPQVRSGWERADRSRRLQASLSTGVWQRGRRDNDQPTTNDWGQHPPLQGGTPVAFSQHVSAQCESLRGRRVADVHDSLRPRYLQPVHDCSTCRFR
jgi:hypothetical protein